MIRVIKYTSDSEDFKRAKKKKLWGEFLRIPGQEKYYFGPSFETFCCDSGHQPKHSLNDWEKHLSKS